MAKTSYIKIPPELEEKYYSDLQSRDRFIVPGIRAKGIVISRKKRKDLQSKTLLDICSNYWKNFTDEQRANWKAADQHNVKHGWRTFVSDQTSRILLGLEGVTTPSEYHQGKVGYILIEDPAEEIKLIQPHPSSYWVKSKVVGKDGMYEPKQVTEILALPLEIGLSYKSDLISTGPGSFVHFYASIRHLYQGQNLNHDLIIDIPLQSHWYKETQTISELLGIVTSYNLYIHLYNVRGELFFDNITSKHSGSNWARDTFCEKIEESFTRGFYQIPKHWAPVTLPAGAIYYSKYVGSEIYEASIYGLKWYGIANYGDVIF